MIACMVAAFLAGGNAMENEGKIGNLSKARRERLVAEVGAIRAYLERSAGTDTNATRLLEFAAELEKEVRGKKYGLVFEEHRERVDVELEENIPVLRELKDRFLATRNTKGTEPLNFLIEGDNLAALKLLEKTHRGRIDLIYIDPPYNTGNKDFMYNDSYVDKADTFRHSKWLSFMKKRLRIAKSLLKKDGVIFISIDNNEGFQLKLLMDEIFGEESFAADLHIETSAIAGPRRFAAVNGSVVKTTEFIFGYVNGSDTQIMRHPMHDFIPGFDTHYSLFYDSSRKTFVKFVDVLKNNKTVREVFTRLKLPISLRNLGKVLLIDDSIKSWLYSDAIAENLYREGGAASITLADIENSHQYGEMISYKGALYRVGNNKVLTILFRYKDRIGACDDYFSSFGERCIRGNLWKGFSADGGNLAKEGFVSFKNGKKPKRLLLQLIQAVSSEENKDLITVLDFFAGSGTTGHAVMELNEKDGGHRSFILVNNNDEGICENVTYERLKRVMKKEKYAARLKYMKVEYVPISEDGYWERAEELLKYIRELVELENGIDFGHDPSVEILLKDGEVAAFVGSKKRLAACRTLYRGHNVLIGSKAMSEITKHGIEVKTIPDYYFPELED